MVNLIVQKQHKGRKRVPIVFFLAIFSCFGVDENKFDFFFENMIQNVKFCCRVDSNIFMLV